MMRLVLTLTLLTVVFFSSSLPTVDAQSETYCGCIVEGEFSETRETQSYQIALSPGDILRVNGESVGEYLTWAIFFDSPSGRQLIYSGDGGRPLFETKPLSERGIYTIRVESRLGAGPYTLYLGCTLRDLTVIAPGESCGSIVQASPTSVPTVEGTSLYGFPGIPAIAFSDTVEIPLSQGQTYNGAFTGGGESVFAYIYETTGNSTADLYLNRVSGDISLGIAVINKTDNEPIFAAALASAEAISARVLFPRTGLYTIGVFRLDITPGQSGASGAYELRLE